MSAWVQQLKLCVHAREWTASKLRPRVYGQQLDVSVQHTQISILAALELAQKRVIAAGLSDDLKVSEDQCRMG